MDYEFMCHNCKEPILDDKDRAEYEEHFYHIICKYKYLKDHISVVKSINKILVMYPEWEWGNGFNKTAKKKQKELEEL